MKMKYIAANLFRSLLRVALAVVLLAASVVTSNATNLVLGTNRIQRNSGDKLAALPGSTLIQRTVSMGGGHTLAVDESGRLWAWGKNDKGQVGDGTTEDRNAPVQIRDDVAWVAVAAGSNFSLAIDLSGRLWAWGSNSTGQLGDGSNFDSLLPKQVGTATDWRAVSAGDLHVLALKTDGSLHGWGSNAMGQLGKDPLGNWSTTPTYSYSPVVIHPGQWLSVAAGGAHSVAIYAPTYAGHDYTIRTWGANNRGQLNRANTDVGLIYDYNLLWDGYGAIGSSDIQAIAAGAEFTVLLERSFGRVLAYGDNTYGQLGPLAGGPQSSIVEVISGGATSIAAGKHHAVALLDGDGAPDFALAWGRGTSGQVPAGGGSALAFIDVNGAAVIGVAAGEQGSLAVVTGGSISTIGRNIEGQHGDGVVQQLLDWTKKTDKQWSQIAVGERHALGIDLAGNLFAWGNNSAGQLGDGSTTAFSSPISPSVGASTWQKVAVSSNNSAAITSGGALYVWGSNFYGQVGNGSSSSALVPVQVPGLWLDVALGATHTLAVKADGTLWAWGSNSNAQLGAAKSSTNQLVPRRVGIATNWTKVAAGDNHSLGLQTNNFLYAWGSNILGQLGNGNNNDLAAPTKIGTKTWLTLAAAGSNSAAVDATGKLFVWGSNNNGQLGLGNTQPANSPKPLLATQSFTSVSVAAASMGAITSSKALYMWGLNEDGRLGDETTINRNTPVDIGGTWDSLALGGGAGVALRNSDLYVWGSNKYGQLNESVVELAASKAALPDAPNATILAYGDTNSISNQFDYAESELIQFVASPSGTGPFTYQWYKDDAEITGAKGPAYEVKGSAVMNGVSYSVVVSSSYGGPNASNAIAARLWEAPVISEGPSNQAVLIGGTASLTVQASGTNLSYSWQVASVPVASTQNYAPGVAGLTPTTYSVIVSNTRNGVIQTDDASAIVTGYNPVSISVADANSNAVGSDSVIRLDRAAGQRLTLSVSASNAASYQWRKDLEELTGETGNTLALSSLTALSGGSYDVVVSNPASSVTSKSAVVRIYSAPVFTRHPTSQTVGLGRTATLTAAAVGYNVPTLQWYGPQGAISGANTGVLVLANFSLANYGAYYVKATNNLGEVVSEVATLTAPGAVGGKPSISAPLLSQSVVSGTSATFFVSASAATHYQWRKNGVAIPGANSATLVVGSVSSTDYASYSVVVSNSVGSLTSAPALLSSRSDVVGDDRRTLFNSAVGLNGGLYAGRFKGGAGEGYIRLNVTRVGTVSGVYTDGLVQYRFGGRFSLVGSEWVTSINLGGGPNVLRIAAGNDASAPVVSAQLLPGGVASGVALPLARQGVRDSSLAPIYTGAYQDKVTGSLAGVVSARVNTASGVVIFTGALPDGGRLSGTSAMYADPAGIQSALLSDLILRLSATKRVFSTLALSPESFTGDASVVTAVSTAAYDLTGAAYTVAPLGGLLTPFVSVRDQAIVNLVQGSGSSEVSTELGRFTASGNRLLPLGSAFASAGGRFSLTFAPATGQVSGFVSFGSTGADRTPRRFTGVILQGGYRLNGGLLGVGVTDTGETIRFEPAN